MTSPTAAGRRGRPTARSRCLAAVVAGLVTLGIASSGPLSGVVASAGPAGTGPAQVAESGAAGNTAALTALLKSLEMRGYRPGTMPPSFSGKTHDTRTLSLADLRGKVVIVTFWATWCLECRPEMPMLEALHRELGNRGLAIVGVNAREDDRAVARYARELDLTFPLVLDRDGATNVRYGVIGIPTTFVVGRDGRAVGFAVGPRDWSSVAARTLISTLLAEPDRHAR